jgi:type IV pilus assembly protein PilA
MDIDSLRLRSDHGFTLVELVIVVIIIGILAGLSLPIFSAAKEKSLDKEAKTALTLIYSANKVYHSQNDNFYPPGGSGGYAAINQNLNLDLSTTNWSYSISGASGAYTATATRSGRTWIVNQGSPVPTCSGSCLP